MRAVACPAPGLTLRKPEGTILCFSATFSSGRRREPNPPSVLETLNLLILRLQALA
jgi:hypothetical protein